eukprot:1395542-Amorphochlora_amoeboformis.AAC.1
MEEHAQIKKHLKRVDEHLRQEKINQNQKKIQAQREYRDALDKQINVRKKVISDSEHTDEFWLYDPIVDPASKPTFKRTNLQVDDL